MPQIVARGLSWQHAGRSQPAINELDLSIEHGERILLAGDSGSGKSTLMAALAGVLGGDDEGTLLGELTINAANVGLVLQDPDSQVIASRVGDDVAFGCENLGLARDDIWRRVHRSLEMVGLDLDIDHPTARLSGGQKQRLALAGVIAMGAEVILLDEPTANLDPQGAADVVAAVNHVVEETGATLIVIEHNYNDWAPVLNRAIVLHHGEKVYDGDVQPAIEARKITDLPVARTQLADASPALWSKDLITRFGPARTLAIPEGASTVITGANGSGKTTWLMTMAGLIDPASGELGYSDNVRKGLAKSPHKWTSAQLAHRIGFVFQNPEHQFVARNVIEEMRVGPQVMGEKVDQERIDKLLERLRLTSLIDANPFTLSGGEKRRLSVATALVTAPNVVLLDEPTFGQDPQTFAELVRMIRELADSGVTVASITHDELFISALADAHLVVSADA
ncbi:ABC transporter ATP-binding protein [Corynebacterium sp.]|uniref:ABC transporter ATP-binding protein n=1 Tax=Corynebacterium sp. TaxID=1720 RepID=UPI0028AFFD11|nr:ABC transporter ATP-binding protein [Corynebacterium sp.]